MASEDENGPIVRVLWHPTQLAHLHWPKGPDLGVGSLSRLNVDERQNGLGRAIQPKLGGLTPLTSVPHPPCNSQICACPLLFLSYDKGLNRARNLTVYGPTTSIFPNWRNFGGILDGELGSSRTA